MSGVFVCGVCAIGERRARDSTGCMLLFFVCVLGPNSKIISAPTIVHLGYQQDNNWTQCINLPDNSPICFDLTFGEVYKKQADHDQPPAPHNLLLRPSMADAAATPSILPLH